jgi:diketogulonate reductase-like aldo/keto reductase
VGCRGRGAGGVPALDEHRPVQVAIAWTRARSRAVHPILGARTVEQLADNLGAHDCELPDEAIQRLEEASGFVAGFPTDFIEQTSPWVFGQASQRVDGR